MENQGQRNESAAIAKIFARRVFTIPRSWDEWLEMLSQSKSREQFYSHLETALGYREWRIEAVYFLLDLMDYSGDGIYSERFYHQDWRKNKDSSKKELIKDEIKTIAADQIIFWYLKESHETLSFCHEPLWVIDVCRGDKAIFPRLLRSLRLHENDGYFDREDRHPRAAVKKFLKYCHDAQGGRLHEGLKEIVDDNKVELFKAWITFDLRDISHESNRAAMDALRIIALGLDDEIENLHRKPNDPPKDLREAVISESFLRREAARKLLILEEISKAKERKAAQKRKEQAIQNATAVKSS